MADTAAERIPLKSEKVTIDMAIIVMIAKNIQNFDLFFFIKKLDKTK